MSPASSSPRLRSPRRRLAVVAPVVPDVAATLPTAVEPVAEPADPRVVRQVTDALEDDALGSSVHGVVTPLADPTEPWLDIDGDRQATPASTLKLLDRDRGPRRLRTGDQAPDSGGVGRRSGTPRAGRRGRRDAHDRARARCEHRLAERAGAVATARALAASGRRARCESGTTTPSSAAHRCRHDGSRPMCRPVSSLLSPR